MQSFFTTKRELIELYSTRSGRDSFIIETVMEAVGDDLSVTSNFPFKKLIKLEANEIPNDCFPVFFRTLVEGFTIVVRE